MHTPALLDGGSGKSPAMSAFSDKTRFSCAFGALEKANKETFQVGFPNTPRVWLN